MTLLELIKDKRFSKETYLALHNANGSRFYGCFVGCDQIKDYYEYEVSEVVKHSNTLYSVTLPSYTDNLGFDSLRMFEEKSKKAKEALKKRQY